MGDVFDTPELIAMAHASNPSIPDEDPQTEIDSMISMVTHLREMADRRELEKQYGRGYFREVQYRHQEEDREDI